MSYLKASAVFLMVMVGLVIIHPRPALANGCCYTLGPGCADNITPATCQAANQQYFDNQQCSAVTVCHPGPSQTTDPSTGSSATVQIISPIKCQDATCLAAQVIRYVLGVIAIIATLMFVWGGIMMMTSGGNADQVKKAKETLVWAAIGIVVILGSWAIIQFVLKGITGATK